MKILGIISSGASWNLPSPATAALTARASKTPTVSPIFSRKKRKSFHSTLMFSKSKMETILGCQFAEYREDEVNIVRIWNENGELSEETNGFNQERKSEVEVEAEKEAKGEANAKVAAGKEADSGSEDSSTDGSNSHSDSSLDDDDDQYWNARERARRQRLSSDTSSLKFTQDHYGNPERLRECRETEDSQHHKLQSRRRTRMGRTRRKISGKVEDMMKMVAYSFRPRQTTEQRRAFVSCERILNVDDQSQRTLTRMRGNRDFKERQIRDKFWTENFEALVVETRRRNEARWEARAWTLETAAEVVLEANGSVDAVAKEELRLMEGSSSPNRNRQSVYKLIKVDMKI